MGMYTEIYVNADLKEDTPTEVLEVLKAMCRKDSDSNFLNNKPSRWSLMFSNGSYYTPLTECGKLSFDVVGGHYSLIAKGDIKNYNNEIKDLFEFIKPWCDDEFIGYYRHENDREPTLVYSDE